MTFIGPPEESGGPLDLTLTRPCCIATGTGSALGRNSAGDDNTTDQVLFFMRWGTKRGLRIYQEGIDLTC